MNERARTHSRQGFLGRGLILAAGALGLGAGKAAGAMLPAESNSELTLYGRSLHLHGQNRRAGVVPVKGERLTGYAELSGQAGGPKLGEFSAARFALESPFSGTGGAASLELHSFNLQDGTILGLGTAAADGESVFAITGGTGRYAGARGTYTARQHPRELGGNGTAEFRFSLITKEVTNNGS